MSAPIKPEYAPWVSPYITVDDVDAAKAFYEKAFCFVTREAVPNEEGQTQHLEMTYHDQLVMFGKQGACESTVLTPKNSNVPCPIYLYLYCADVDSFYQNAVAAGATGIMKPEDTFWGDRMCQLQDLDGYIWSFATLLTK